MKIRSLLFLLLCFACSTNTKNNKQIMNNQDGKRNYKLILDDVILQYSLGRTVSLDSLQNSIPRTMDEFLIYYHTSDTENEKRKYFFKLDSEIGFNAANNKGDFLRLYLELSSFVDGEYAESYFQDADFIISKNKKAFCEIYSKLSDNSKKKLEENAAQDCK